jgi:nucleoside-diphosphate-sugar epimerase
LRRVLLTGATGVLGRQAQVSLESRGYEVHAVSRRPPDEARPGLTWHESDLLDLRGVSALVDAAAPTDLLHLAWCSEPDTYWDGPENERWHAASVALLDAFASAGGRRAVVSGTCAEYDWSCADSPLSEARTPLAPVSAYGRAKDQLRRDLELLAAERGISAAWARVFFLFGPGEDPRRLVASVARALVNGEPAACSEGHQVRDYLVSIESADALAALLESDVEGAVNVASGDAVSVRHLVGVIGAVTGRPELLRYGAVPSRPNEPTRIEADTGRLAHEVGWRPRRGLREGVEETVAWWARMAG